MGFNIYANSKESLEGSDCKGKKDLSQMGEDELVTVERMSQDDEFESASSEQEEDWRENMEQKSSEGNLSPRIGQWLRAHFYVKDSLITHIL